MKWKWVNTRDICKQLLNKLLGDMLVFVVRLMFWQGSGLRMPDRWCLPYTRCSSLWGCRKWSTLRSAWTPLPSAWSDCRFLWKSPRRRIRWTRCQTSGDQHTTCLPLGGLLITYVYLNESTDTITNLVNQERKLQPWTN